MSIARIRTAAGVIAALAAAAASATAQQGAAQQGAHCDTARAQWFEGPRSHDSVVVYVTLRSIGADAAAPAWYLSDFLSEVGSRFPALGVVYDPLVDVSLPVTVTRAHGAVARSDLVPPHSTMLIVDLTGEIGGAPHSILGTSSGSFGDVVNPLAPPQGIAALDPALATRRAQMRRVLNESLRAQSSRARFKADASSALTHLALAVATAQAEQILPPLPADVGDSLELLLVLHPSVAGEPPTADTRSPTIALFRSPGLCVGDGAAVLYEGETDVPARSERENQPPRWPREMRGRRGAVLLAIAVDERGRVEHSRTRVVASTGAFDAAVLEAVRGWHFVPAERSGCAVASLRGQLVVFSR